MIDKEDFYKVLAETILEGYKSSDLFKRDAIDYVFDEFQNRINGDIAITGEDCDFSSNDETSALKELFRKKNEFNNIFNEYFYDN